MSTFIRAAWALGAFLGTYLLATRLLLVFGGAIYGSRRLRQGP